MARHARSVPGALLPRRVDAPLAALGAGVYAVAYLFRAVRLNALLPVEQRLGLLRAWSVSAGTTFLLQVVPFRGGEVASWGLLKRELGLSWPRAGAVLALVKSVDTATLLLAGLAGGAVVAARRGAAVLGGSVAAACAAGAVALAFLPAVGSRVLETAAARLPERPRLRRVADELRSGLEVARERPALYFVAYGASVGFFVLHLLAVSLLLSALGVTVSVAVVALATLAATVAASLPSPAGTFGPMESGFVAGLALEGVPLGQAAAAAAAVHLLAVAVTGALSLPLLRGRKVRPSPPGTATPG